MKLSKIICKIIYRCRSIPPCITRTSRVEVDHSPSPSVLPTLTEIGAVQTKTTDADGTHYDGVVNTLTTSSPSDRSAVALQKTPNEIDIPATGTITFCPWSDSPSEDWTDILPDGAPSHDALSTSMPTATAEGNEIDAMPISDMLNLQREYAKLQVTSKRQQDEIQRLATHLEASRITILHLEHAKSSKPKRMKKQITSLSQQLQFSQAEVKEYRTRCAKFAWAAGLREEVGRTKDVLEECVSELEAQAAEWRTRMEEVAKMARQVERKGKGLGMWWNREFEDLGETWDRDLNFDGA